MSSNAHLSEIGIGVGRWLAVIALMASSAAAQLSNVQSNVIGPEDPEKQIAVTVWLNLHNQADLDNMVEQMYDKTSPNYHQFLTLKQFKAQFAPTAKEAATVSSYLARAT